MDEQKCNWLNLSNTKLRDLMSHPVYAVHENADLSSVEQILIEHKIRHLPVLDEENRIIGIISQRDIYRTVSPRMNEEGKIQYVHHSLVEQEGCYYDKQALNDFILYHVMKKNPEVLFPDDTLKKAVHLMVNKKIGCIPLINERREVIGIITRYDILKAMDTLFGEIEFLNN